MQVANKTNIPMANALILDAEPLRTLKPPQSSYDVVRKLASGNAVVLFSMSGCCMCTVAKRLLFSLGVGPTVIELDEIEAGGGGAGYAAVRRDIEAVLHQLAAEGKQQQVIPAVFVGGKFLGGIEALMACHINGSLVPLLKNAGALWL